MHYNKTSKHTNSITSRENNSWFILHGNPTPIEETINNVKNIPGDASSEIPVLYFPHTVFRQANLDGFANIVKEIRRWVPLKGSCIELYAGVGTIGLNLVDLVESISCSDENPNNSACFHHSLAGLSRSLQLRAQYASESAAVVATSTGLRHCDYVIVDPPRKGLDTEVLDALCDTTGDATTLPLRLIYVSCGFKAFQRDCARLIEHDWSLVHAEGHILFPGADHIEILAIFDRCSDYI